MYTCVCAHSTQSLLYGCVLCCVYIGGLDATTYVHMCNCVCAHSSQSLLYGCVLCVHRWSGRNHLCTLVYEHTVLNRYCMGACCVYIGGLDATTEARSPPTSSSQIPLTSSLSVTQLCTHRPTSITSQLLSCTMDAGLVPGTTLPTAGTMTQVFDD